MSKTDAELKARMEEILGKARKASSKAEPEASKDPFEGLLPKGAPTYSETQSFSELFGWVPEDGDFEVPVYSGYSNVPEVIPEYIFQHAETEAFVRSIVSGLNTRLVGHAGGGKTSLPEQVAARTGRPCYIQSFNEFLEPPEVVGDVRLIGGETKFLEGPLTQAIKEPCIVVFDEYTRATAAMTMALQRFPEKRELFLAGNMGGDVTVKAHPEMALVVADNTRGLGDDIDKYVSANVQDVSTLNRWHVTIEIPYPSRQIERDFILKVQPDFPEKVADTLSKISQEFHKGFITGEFSLPFSMRNLRAVAFLAMQYRSLEKALDLNYLAALEESERGAAEQIVKYIAG